MSLRTGERREIVRLHKRLRAVVTFRLAANAGSALAYGNWRNLAFVLITVKRFERLRGLTQLLSSEIVMP